MRRENGYGSVYKLSGNRRKPWIARVTIEYDEQTGKQTYETIGYFKTEVDAEFALNEYLRSNEYGSNVYFITDGRFTKIGKANDVLRRLKELQTATPYELEILRIFKCSNEREAYNLEQFFHTSFQDKRVKGEWFEIPIEGR